MDEGDLTDDQRAALDALIPPELRTGDLKGDLVAGAKEVWDRRQTNTVLGGRIFAAMRAMGLSWRQIDELTGIPWSTARRWHERLPGMTERPEETPPTAP
jgi:hypothetical protein